MYCPECGHEAANAKFCPECGADLAAVRGALKDPKIAGEGGGRGAGAARKGAAPAPSGGLSPRLLWAVIAVVAVAVVVIVAVASGGSEQPAGDTPTDGMPTTVATPVPVDLSGSYRELVQRAHDLYDEGDRLFAAEEIEQGVAYFAAAAQVYEAAWKKEPGDPNVGTDWATSLFYSGDFDGAVERVRAVLEENPDFQAGWFNLGNYLTHQARMAESGDDQTETARLYGEASEAYSKAAAIDPESDTGLEAAARAAELAQ